MSLAKSCGSRRTNGSRSGFTLLEVLVATAVTLLMMVSLAQIFKVIGDSMKQGRAALELNSRIRNVAHRIQLDLNNMTADPKLGSDAFAGNGYLKIYDGPLTDFSYGMELATANRFGDVDDILMFTARAGDDWFTGKVPLFVLQNAGLPVGSAVPITTANTELVTITAQHAEIVIFVEPLVTNEANPDRDPAYLALDPANNFAKLLNPATAAVTNLPSSYRLHYRTLLIRPDLNNGAGVLPGGLDNGTPQRRWLQANHGTATFGTTTVSLPIPTCDMANAHQQCDLSIRRIDPASAPSAVAANSLEDLTNPANRFAHIQLPFTNTNFSMPVLALSPKLNMTYTLAEPGALITSASAAADKANPANNQSGFIHPAYILRSDITLQDDRTGEDMLASDVLAFDVKGYDPGATLFEITSGGNTFVVTPNDPGYGTGLASGTAIATGEFVDIGWGRKSQVHHGASGIGQLSGVDSTGGEPFTDSMYKSGLAMQTGALPAIAAAMPFVNYSANLQIFQPSYDTWNQKFEGDGLFQAELTGTRGVVRVNTGIAQGLREPWRHNGSNYIIDAGTDGIDNTGSPSGVDDLAERETSAPFPIDLRGIKVSIRIEDPVARQFNQVSVVKEFVTQ